MNLSNVAWVTKYRPKTVDDVVGSEAEEMKKYIQDPRSMPNFLFASRVPGTGKTTLARAVANDLDADLLELNSSMDRTLDFVRTKIKDFVATMSTNEDSKKIVFLDEADGLPTLTQQSLRNLMEAYSHNAVFILTCNYQEKIIDALQSRCVVMSFEEPDRESVKDYLSRICESEGLDYDTEGLNKLIDIHYPSIRDMVQELQTLHTRNQSVTIDYVKRVHEQAKQIWDLIVAKKLFPAKKKFIEIGMEPQAFVQYCYEKVFDGDELSASQRVRLERVLAELDYRLSRGCMKTLQVTNAFNDIFKVVVKG